MKSHLLVKLALLGLTLHTPISSHTRTAPYQTDIYNASLSAVAKSDSSVKDKVLDYSEIIFSERRFTIFHAALCVAAGGLVAVAITKGTNQDGSKYDEIKAAADAAKEAADAAKEAAKEAAAAAAEAQKVVLSNAAKAFSEAEAAKAVFQVAEALVIEAEAALTKAQTANEVVPNAGAQATGQSVVQAVDANEVVPNAGALATAVIEAKNRFDAATKALVTAKENATAAETTAKAAAKAVAEALIKTEEALIKKEEARAEAAKTTAAETSKK